MTNSNKRSFPTTTPNSLQDEINNFVIAFCTKNGSGSITANSIILRSIFKMGIPVSAKNIYPSNIQGMPTWYVIRVNKYGHLGRVEMDNIVVAMNPDSFLNDVSYLVDGGVLFYDDRIKQEVERDDIIKYPMPVRELIQDVDVPRGLRAYISNMVYIGIMAEMLSIDMTAIENTLKVQ